MSAIFTINTPVHVRAVAEYQLFTDDEGYNWMFETLQQAQAATRIQSFVVLSSERGVFGLQLVTFTVDLYLGAETAKGIKRDVRKLLNELIGDTDVNVRWIAPLD